MSLVKQGPPPPEDGAVIYIDSGVLGKKAQKAESNLDKEVDWFGPPIKGLALFCLGTFLCSVGYAMLSQAGLAINAIAIGLVWAFVLGRAQQSWQWIAWRSSEALLVCLGFGVGVWRILI